MDLTTVVEHIELALTTGNAKKDQGTNYRARLFAANNELLVHQHWIGDNGGTAGEWFGSGATYWPGPNLPNWGNNFDEWHASHGGMDITLMLLRGGRLEIEIGSIPQTDHWQLKAVVWAKLRGNNTLVALSPDPGGFTGIASDGEHGWPPTLAVPLTLIV